MFDPLVTIGSLLGMVVDIVNTTIAAMILPFMQLVVYPLTAVLGWLT